MITFSKFRYYASQSGPGWIQAAVTLGGGTLVSALYLGVIGGYQFLWLQPLAMLFGYVMLVAISHVTLSKSNQEDRPFKLIERHVSKFLAWGWLIASVVANVVFCSAQFALGTDALQGSLGLLKDETYVITFLLFLFGMVMMWLFSRESKISQLLDKVIKVLVAIIVLCFFAATLSLAFNGDIQFSALLSGLIPDFTALFHPTGAYNAYISHTGAYQTFWENYISGSQRDIIIGAFGTAVGINMTFLLPYTLQKRGWGKADRELARFDLFFGLFIPFILGASFLIIVTASQFHAQRDSLVNEQAFHQVIDQRLSAEYPQFSSLSDSAKEQLRNNLPQADNDLSTMLAKRTVTDLSISLRPILGDWSKLIFGVGVLAMAISTMLVHMMINGYAIAEALGQPKNAQFFIIGAFIPAFTGFLSPILWSGAIKTSLAVPASVIATTLLPIAYLVFLLLMNSKKALDDELPAKRLLPNIAMILAFVIATFASFWAIWAKVNSVNPLESNLGWVGMIGLPALMVLGIVSFFKKEKS
ncbi:MAG: divalent metal cation transporter [Cytophagales bacterium]|nr:divalent metal cation transporter [Cytophagales bacterium]